MSIKISSKGILKISFIVFSLVIINQITIVDAANALTRYFNCTTRIANSQSTFSLNDAETCYDKVFKGALDNDRYGNPLDKP
ncbi:hypothetical protein [Candidatus Nitrosocosmicus sp. R]